jgi:hypothetical protein
MDPFYADSQQNYEFLLKKKKYLNGIILVRHTLCNEDKIYSVQCDQSFYSPFWSDTLFVIRIKFTPSSVINLFIRE